MQNQLLQQFPEETLARWQPVLRKVRLEFGAVLQAVGQPAAHVYFPIDCVVAISLDAPAGKSFSVCLVGQYGMVGLHVLLGATRASESASVLIAGNAWRLDTGTLMTEFSRGGEVTKRLLSRIQAKVSHINQAAYCSHHHSLEQQLCLRLLQMIDLSGCMALNLTQAQLGDVVGGRRENVNRCLSQLGNDGIVDVARSGLRILSRRGLLQRACACHEVMADADARAIGQPR